MSEPATAIAPDQPPPPPAASAPPHPFRAAPWYDPRAEHRPCECPRCRAAGLPARPRRVARVVLSILGGVALPLVALGFNAALEVVELGVLGHLAILLSVASTAATLKLSPTWRDRAAKRTLHRPPASTAARVVLLLGALLGCLTWGYLGVLFLPLLPLSLIALILLGLGLCGLCPYLAGTISLLQAIRAVRAVRERLGGRRTLALTLGALLGPPLLAAWLGVAGHLGQTRLERALDRVASLPPHSAERLAAVAALDQGSLLRAYLRTGDQDRRALIADAYLRVADESLHGAVAAVSARHRRAIRPWWFLDGGPAQSGRDFLILPREVLR